MENSTAYAFLFEMLLLSCFISLSPVIPFSYFAFLTLAPSQMSLSERDSPVEEISVFVMYIGLRFLMLLTWALIKT